MKDHIKKTVALVGMGVIGRGWMRVFADAGCEVQIYDANNEQVAKALSWLEKAISRDIEEGFIAPEKGKRSLMLVQGHDRLDQALAGAQYIQESVPERLSFKQAIFAELDEIASAEAILASSTSSLNINEITQDLADASRCIMVHPFNPSYVLPVVEVLPADRTDPMVTKQTVEFLTDVGQVPILLKKYVCGFIGNRIQAAVVREAIHLVSDGVADVSMVDAMMCHGLGLRWAFMGSFID
jgi:3-hydroxyacyl-CoA dehydrogenase